MKHCGAYQCNSQLIMFTTPPPHPPLPKANKKTQLVTGMCALYIVLIITGYS